MPSGWISPTVRLQVHQEHQRTCIYCGKKVLVIAELPKEIQLEAMRTYSADIATLDHVIPYRSLAKRFKGKTLKKRARCVRNLVTACNGCNSRKKHLSVRSFCKRYNLPTERALAAIEKRQKVSCSCGYCGTVRRKRNRKGKRL